MWYNYYSRFFIIEWLYDLYDLSTLPLTQIGLRLTGSLGPRPKRYTLLYNHLIFLHTVHDKTSFKYF